jgi:hypothetical protein
MNASAGLLPPYHRQVAVEPFFQLIVEQTGPQADNYKQQPVLLIGVIRKQSGHRPEEVVVGSGD